MKNSKKPILITVTILAVALIGYFVTDGTFNMSPSDAAGSGIDGIKAAQKYNKAGDVVVDLNDADMQDLLQNDDFQKLMQNDDFVELMKSDVMSDFANYANFEEIASKDLSKMSDDPNVDLIAKKDYFNNLRKSNTYGKVASNDKFSEMLSDDKFKNFTDNDEFSEFMSKEEYLKLASKESVKKLASGKLSNHFSNLMKSAKNNAVFSSGKFKEVVNDKEIYDKMVKSASSGQFDISKGFKGLSKSAAADFKAMVLSDDFKEIIKEGNLKDLADVVSDENFQTLAKQEGFLRKLADNKAALEALSINALGELAKSPGFTKFASKKDFISAISDKDFKTCASSDVCMKFIQKPGVLDLAKSDVYNNFINNEDMKDLLEKNGEQIDRLMKTSKLKNVIQLNKFSDLEKMQDKVQSKVSNNGKLSASGAKKGN